MPPDSVDALEMPNELDSFITFISGIRRIFIPEHDPSAPNYYGAYGQAVTKDCWQAIKSDPALASIKIIGPTVGPKCHRRIRQVPLQICGLGRLPSLSGKSEQLDFSGTLRHDSKVLLEFVSASVNVSADPYGGNPLMFNWYQPAFANGTTAKSMVATETGYHTASQAFGESASRRKLNTFPGCLRNISEMALYEPSCMNCMTKARIHRSREEFWSHLQQLTRNQRLRRSQA